LRRLGQKKAVTSLEDIKKGVYANDSGKLLTMAAENYDSNAGILCAANNFSGCIVGLHEVLRRTGSFRAYMDLE